MSADDDTVLTTLGDLSGRRGFRGGMRRLTRAGVPGLLVAGPAGMIVQRQLQKRGGAARLLRGGGAGLLIAGPAGMLVQRNLQRRGAADVPMAGVGDLGRFRIGRIARFVKPLAQLAKPALSLVTQPGMLGKGGGLLAAMGPMGWAAAGTLAAGGAAAAIIARRRQKKKARRRQQPEETAAQPQPEAAPTYAPSFAPMAMPTYDAPTAPADFAPQMPSGEAMTVDSAPMPEADAMPTEVAVPGGMPSSPEQPSTDVDVSVPVLDAVPAPDHGGEMPVMAGLGAPPTNSSAALFTVALLGLGAWWLMRAPTQQRR